MRGEAGWGGSKNAGLKSCPILIPPPLRGRETHAGWSGEGRVKQSEAKLSFLITNKDLSFFFIFILFGMLFIFTSLVQTISCLPLVNLDLHLTFILKINYELCGYIFYYLVLVSPINPPHTASLVQSNPHWTREKII